MNLLSLIFSSYSTLSLVIGAVAGFAFLTGVYFIVRSHRELLLQSVLTLQMTPIAGDDVIATQLDLARAYLETGSIILAKTILKSVEKQGSASQREEAKRLLNHV